MSNVVASKPVDILTVLAEQHEEIHGLLDRLFASRKNREIGFLDLASRIAAHVAVETRVFYPSVMLESSDLLSDTLTACAMIKKHVADMLGLDADGHDVEEFDLKLGQLTDMIHRHSKMFEENVLFPLLAELLDDEERRDLGAKAKSMYEALLRAEEDSVQQAA